MPAFIAEIKPKKFEYDPLAHTVQALLHQEGETAAAAGIRTHRLYRIEGPLTKDTMKTIAENLLTDPVVESYVFYKDDGSRNAPMKTKGAHIDVWLKAGVTDPVGETVEKGIRDLGLAGAFKAFSAVRYCFPKFGDTERLKDFAVQHLANELIHDIHLAANP